MIPTLKNLWPLAILLVGATPAFTQGRDSAKKDGQAETPAEKPYRVVERDGTQRVGRLVFRGGGYQVEKMPDFAPAPDGEPGEDGAPGQDGAPGADGGGGRSSGGDGGGRNGGGGGNQALGLDYLRKVDRALSELDRIEQDGKVVFVANERLVKSKRVTAEGYAGDYGGLAFSVPQDWKIVEATAGGAIAIRRDEAGDIIGRVRLSLLVDGDGQNAKRTLEPRLTKPESVFRKLDRERFASITTKNESDETTFSGLSVRRVVHDGVELLTQQPLHLEANVPLDGPFFPSFEILARGPQLAAVLEQGRWMLESLKLEREKAVPPQLEEDKSTSGPDPFGGLGGSPRDLLAALQELSKEFQSPFVVKGKLDQPFLGIAVKATLPDGWVYHRVDDLGFAVTRVPAANAGFFDLGYGLAAILDGKVTAEDPMGFVCERYLAALPPIEDPKLAPKIKKGKLGSYSDKSFVYVLEYGSRGSEARLGVHAIEHQQRMIVISRLASGQGTMPATRLEELAKWLKNLVLTPPKPKPAE